MNLRVVEKAIAHYTNKERRRRNLRKMRRSGTLVKAARGHAQWCAGRNRMTHTGTGGTQPWQRARQVGYPSQGVAENMWQQHGQNNTTYKSRFRWRSDWEFGKAAVITWMNSPGHRSNLLDPRWTDIGVGLSRRNGHTMLVQMFGDRPAPPPKMKMPSVKQSRKPQGGPYSHFHNWSFHTHHNRPKGGNHYRAVRRRQRPWRIALWVVLMGVLIATGVMMAARYDVLPRVAMTIDSTATEVRASNQERSATRTAQARIDERTRVADVSLRAEATVSELERKVHAGINAARVNNGGSALEWDDGLASIARAHSDDMTNRNYFSHDTPEGMDPTDRLHRAGLNCRKGYRYGIAENIAIETSIGNMEQTATEAVKGWMNSPGHRRNLLNREYSTTGVGASFGAWRGYESVYLTQVFC